MIPNRQPIDSRPEPKPTPFPGMGMHRSRDDQDNKVAGNSSHDGEPTSIRPIADPCKEKDDGREGVCLNAREADNPLFPSSRSIPAPRSGEIALPPNIPKNSTATLLASSRFVYYVDKVYMEAGLYPASARPRNMRVARNPALFLMRPWRMAMTPNMKTCAAIHLRRPIYKI